MLKCPTNAMLFHHRTPTSTDNVIEACHPFVVDTGKGKIMLVHNGIIYNDDEMFEKHTKLGIGYSSYSNKTKKFNDSECLAIDFARLIGGQQDKLETRGWIAFIAFETDKKNQLTHIYFGRNRIAELNYLWTDDFLSVGSEIAGEEVIEDTLYDFDMKTKEVTTSPLIIPGYVASTGTTGNVLDHQYDDDNDYWDRDYYKQGKFDWAGYYRRKAKDEETRDEYHGDGIIGMTDTKLAELIKDKEDRIQEIEASDNIEKRQKELADLYDELEFASDEQDERKIYGQQTSIE